MPESKCDFCSEPNPGWCYPAQTFQGPTIGKDLYVSVAEWGACDTCHDLIEANDREALVDRFLVRWEAKNGQRPDHDDLRALVLALHGQFWDNRTGPAVHEFSS